MQTAVCATEERLIAPHCKIQISAHLAFLRAIAECFAHLSHRLGVRPSVRPSHCGIVSKRCKLGSRDLHCGLPQGL